jgi:hypothetical protein
MARHLGKLFWLENFDFVKKVRRFCKECEKRTTQELYDGHTFCEGSQLLHCLSCGIREMR